MSEFVIVPASQPESIKIVKADKFKSTSVDFISLADDKGEVVAVIVTANVSAVFKKS